MSAIRLRLLAAVCQVLLFLALAGFPSYAQITLASGTPNFGMQPVGLTNTTTLAYNFSQPTAIAAPTVVTQGAAGLDFTSSSGT